MAGLLVGNTRVGACSRTPVAACGVCFGVVVVSTAGVAVLRASVVVDADDADATDGKAVVI